MMNFDQVWSLLLCCSFAAMILKCVLRPFQPMMILIWLNTSKNDVNFNLHVSSFVQDFDSETHFRILLDIVFATAPHVTPSRRWLAFHPCLGVAFACDDASESPDQLPNTLRTHATLPDAKEFSRLGNILDLEAILTCRFPRMGVPLVIIHFRLGFFLINYPFWGTLHLWNPHMMIHYTLCLSWSPMMMQKLPGKTGLFQGISGWMIVTFCGVIRAMEATMLAVAISKKKNS